MADDIAPLAGWADIVAPFATSPWMGARLTSHLSETEKRLEGSGLDQLVATLCGCSATGEVLTSALRLKALAGQVNVVVHALGVLLSLPQVLEPGEVVESLSLGAGNTGKRFDLETSLRIAEFKLTHWRGGPEAIRQNQLFKDLFLLASHDTTKRRCLYVVGTELPLAFLQGDRALTSVLSRNAAVEGRFRACHGDRFRTVSEYYRSVAHLVEIVDLGELVPALREFGGMLD